MQGSSPRVQTGGTRRGGAGDDGERRTALRTGPRRGGASPGAWTPRVGSWGTCEGEKEVSRLGAATAVSNCSGQSSPAWRSAAERDGGGARV